MSDTSAYPPRQNRRVSRRDFLHSTSVIPAAPAMKRPALPPASRRNSRRGSESATPPSAGAFSLVAGGTGSFESGAGVEFFVMVGWSEIQKAGPRVLRKSNRWRWRGSPNPYPEVK